MSWKGFLLRAGIEFDNGHVSLVNGFGINAQDAQVLSTARIATGTAGGTSISIDASVFQWSEAFELRYHVSDWADVYTLTEFKGIYLRVENREANGSGSIYGAQIYGVANAVNTGNVWGALVYGYAKGALGITVGKLYGIQSEITWDAGSAAQTITTEATPFLGKVTGGQLADYTKVHGMILRFGDMDGGSRLYGSGIKIEDDGDMSGTCTLTNGINIAIGCTTGVLIAGATTNGISISGTPSNADILLHNGATIMNGSAGVLTITETGLSLIGAVSIGADAAGQDCNLFGAVASYKVWWDANGDTNGALYVGADTKGIMFNLYGDITGCGVFWNPSTDTNGTLTIGGSGGSKGNDVVVYGATNGSYLTWDQSVDSLLLIGTTAKFRQGTFHSDTAGSGIVLSAAVTAAHRIYADDGGAKLGAGEKRVGISRFLYATSDTDATDQTMSGYVGQVKVANDLTIGGNLSGLCGYLEVAATKTLIGGRVAQGSIASALWARLDVPATGVIGTDAVVSGLGISANIGGTHTGKAAAIHIPNPSAGVWDSLIRLGDATGTTVVNALVPATAPDGTTMGADLAIIIDVNGTLYYIPAYNSLHA
jgi:hypothetical protein